MDSSIVTQGLLGLVFVLSIALYSRSGTSSPQPGASAKKTNKKKKKTGASAPSKEKAPAIVTPPQAPNGTARAAESVNSIAAPSKVSREQDLNESQEKSNGTSSKKASKAASKKLTLAEFATKTNEERVEELERKARGDAGEKDIGRDMIDKDLSPEVPYKKVARIEPSLPVKKPVQASADDGWENVGGKGKAAPLPIVSKKAAEDAAPNAWASSNPFALLPGSGAEVSRPNGKTLTLNSSSKPSQTSASTAASKSKPGSSASQMTDAQTKKQRQNAAKAQAKKMEKETAEAERLARLTQHKKQLEAERMKDYYKKQQQPASAPFSVQKEASNGARLAKASVNEKGALVWD